MKKIYIILIALITSISVTTSAFAFDIDSSSNTESQISDEEIVTVIVEIEDNPVPASNKVKGYKAKNTQTIENNLLNTQMQVFSQIENTVSNEPKYTYTTAFNGFAVDVPKSQIEEIKNIYNVKNVYVTYPIELHLPASVPQTSSMPNNTIDDFDTNGYTGEGQVVAIIDSGFNTSHEFFNFTPANPKYSKTVIEDKLKNTMAKDEIIDKVHISEKIPFAYNYADGNTTVYLDKNSHGTHVAGIAAGKNAKFSGVAPDAQLVLMRTMTDDGSLSIPTILKALEDAINLDVDIINMSLGTVYASQSVSRLWNSCLTKAREKGITVCSSAGNSKIGFSVSTPTGHINNGPPSVLNPDYSSLGTPSGYSNVMAVASVDNASIYDGNKLVSPDAYTTFGQISASSSWGVDETLELKPEISAPGGNIYSSISDGYYYDSGTSMSSPHMAGIAALMYEWLDDHDSALTGESRIAHIENRLMSTAKIVRQGTGGTEGIAYSPRAQGAGLVNTAAAMTSPAILIDNTSNSGKPKISLKEIIGNSFGISFNVQNLSDTDLVYNLSLEVMIDSADDNNRFKGVSKALLASSTMPATVSVGKNSTETVTFTVTPDASELAKQMTIFKNGFFIDGFVSLTPTNNTPELSIPFTGFYGGWTKAPALDRTMYDNGGSELYMKDFAEYAKGTVLETKCDGEIVICGKTDSGYDKNRIAISPNGDGRGDALQLNITNFRTTKNNTIKLTGSQTYSLPFSGNAPKYTAYTLDFDEAVLAEAYDENVYSFPDGYYNFEYSAAFAYEGASVEAFTLPLVIDRERPELVDVDLLENTLTVKAKDNHLLDFISVFSGDKLIEKRYTQTDSGKNVTMEFKLDENIDLDSIKIEVEDCAKNLISVDLTNALDNVIAHKLLDSEKVTLSLTNTTLANISGNIILACYDNTDKMISAAVKEAVTLSSGVNTPVEYDISNTGTASYFKLFLWNDLVNLKPLDSVKIFH